MARYSKDICCHDCEVILTPPRALETPSGMTCKYCGKWCTPDKVLEGKEAEEVRQRMIKMIKEGKTRVEGEELDN